MGKHAPKDTYDFAIHFGAHVAQIWFLHIKSLGNQSMYKMGQMISVFLNLTWHSAFGHMFTTEKVWHASKWLWWCGMCVSVCGGAGRDPAVHYESWTSVWDYWSFCESCIYATSKSWIGYLKHYTTLSYVHVLATCMHWWSSRTLSLVRLWEMLKGSRWT